VISDLNMSHAMRMMLHVPFQIYLLIWALILKLLEMLVKNLQCVISYLSIIMVTHLVFNFIKHHIGIFSSLSIALSQR
jgi:hypothetical protein